MARSGRVYGYAPDKVLTRMFGAVGDGGLAIDPLDYMPQGRALSEYIPGPSCGWDNAAPE